MPYVLSNLSPEVFDSIKDADKLSGLVEDGICDAMVYCQVRVSHWSLPPCPMPAPDPAATGCLRQESPAHRESHPPAS